jgi:hypothetical protein
MLGFLGLSRRPRATAQVPAPRRTASTVYFRPMLESLEGRIVPSATSVAPAMAPALAAPLAHPSHSATSIVPITVNSVVNTATGLVANASLGSTNFQIPLTLTVPTGQAVTSTTQILNLHLAPIDLSLLGLEVKTSEICLNISAQSGPGNLLGNLLTDVAHLLDQGVPLSQILSGGTAVDPNALTTGLTNLLNGALGQLTAHHPAVSGPSILSPGTTNILHLSVGPLNLNLLGLHVTLDNCANPPGPITVDIIAHSGPGNLLGNLVNGLVHLLDNNAHSHGLVHRLERIVGEILSLI